ncbi:ACT domain-containing protein [Nocardioidaceae bacterium]|nr:ACT domain-containing protein [Nocardioidaceae bacterium]
MTGSVPEPLVDGDASAGNGRTLIRHADQLAVVRLPPGSDLPDWAEASTLLSITATAEETSLVCHASTVPAKATSQGPFAAYEIAGPLDFSLVGVLHGVLGPLAEAEISAFTISTYDTDWLLVPANRVAKADAAWTAAGFEIQVPPEEPEGAPERDKAGSKRGRAKQSSAKGKPGADRKRKTR